MCERNIGDSNLQKAEKTNKHAESTKSATEIKKNTSIITVKDFLDFLRTAYQVNVAVEGVMQSVSPKKDVNWTALANNELIANISYELTEKNNGLDKSVVKLSKDDEDMKHDDALRSTSADKNKVDKKPPIDRSLSTFRRKSLVGRKDAPTAEFKDSPNKKIELQKQVEQIIKHKLSEVLNEGILDSVLPYVVPLNCTQSLGGLGLRDYAKNSIHIQSHLKKDATKKSVSDGAIVTAGPLKSRRRSSAAPDNKHDIEIEIHVCDEVKGTTKDFRCPQGLLVSQMGYFADVQTGQKLEDMDISVHCDIRIFDWLMRWVKRESISPEDCPRLDPSIVVPILVSAYFLQMEPLVQDCLIYCHSNLSDVIRATANLACLNDSIITRLACMYTNSELEAVKDKKDRIQSRLFCNLILSLAEPEPQALRGHYCSLQGLYKCSRCQNLVLHPIAHALPCEPHSMRIDKWGCLVSQHVRDTSWNLTAQITAWYKELRSWRKVYWRLWGSCHYLHCTTCQIMFPVRQMGWCLYHIDPPQFSGSVQTPGIVGRYNCCGQKAFRFEALPRPTGCMYRDHTVEPISEKDIAVVDLYKTLSFAIDQAPPQVVPRTENTWWAGLSLLPNRSKGLVPLFHDGGEVTRPVRGVAPVPSPDTDSEGELAAGGLECYSSSEGEGESECSNKHVFSTKQVNSTRRGVRVTGGLWSGELSARSNQDNQRDYEEKAMRQLVSLLSRKHGCEVRHISVPKKPAGGTYVKLENDWREAQLQWKSQKKNRTGKKNADTPNY